jgi:hypothetical protein
VIGLPFQNFADVGDRIRSLADAAYHVYPEPYAGMIYLAYRKKPI